MSMHTEEFPRKQGSIVLQGKICPGNDSVFDFTPSLLSVRCIAGLSCCQTELGETERAPTDASQSISDDDRTDLWREA